MADYLTKLASRALGVALTAQPVVPSIFAPGPPLAEAISSAWSEQHRQEGLDLEAPGWSPTSSQAMRRELTGPAASPGQTGRDDAGSADSWTRSDLFPSPAWPAEPDSRSSRGLFLQLVGEETEGRPATPAGRPRVPGLGGQASPAAAPAAGVGVVQRQSDAAAHRSTGAPDMPAPERLVDIPRTPSRASNVRATQQSLHAPSGDTSGMPLFESGGIEARPAPSAGRAAPQAAASPGVSPPAASLPASSAERAGRTAPQTSPRANQPASAATLERVTVTRALQSEEAGFAYLAQNANAGDDSAGFGLLLPAESEQAWRLSPEALTQKASREQVSSPLAPAPVIEVTIGRVEVRAVQADRQTGKPKAAAPSSPPLSLEAYLRQQRGNQS